MDSNVSKNTNSHNFFKLRLDRQKLGISIRDLLAKELISISVSYRDKFNVKNVHKSVATIVRRKIAVLNPTHSCRSGVKDIGKGDTAKYLRITGYQCPLGICLAKILQATPSIIVERFGELLIEANDDRHSVLEIELEILSSGWVNFYLSPQFISSWLDLCFYLPRVESDRQETGKLSEISDRAESQLFPAQYIHARCCNLLALAARAKMADLTANAGLFAPIIIQPQTGLWLDERDCLWFTESAAHDLLRQLLIITDAWVGDTGDRQWIKLALNLSHATDLFLANCRFLGEVKVRYPQKAIARLGLIALVQFWLEKILRTKLGLAALHEI